MGEIPHTLKMHTLLDRTAIFHVHYCRPSADVNILDEFLPEAGAFYVMDRGYVDFRRLFVFTLWAFFVVRTKKRFAAASLLPPGG